MSDRERDVLLESAIQAMIHVLDRIGMLDGSNQRHNDFFDEQLAKIRKAMEEDNV